MVVVVVIVIVMIVLYVVVVVVVVVALPSRWFRLLLVICETVVCFHHSLGFAPASVRLPVPASLVRPASPVAFPVAGASPVSLLPARSFLPAPLSPISAALRVPARSRSPSFPSFRENSPNPPRRRCPVTGRIGPRAVSNGWSQGRNRALDVPPLHSQLFPDPMR